MDDDDIRKRRENTRSQIESNDPDLTKLNIDARNPDFIPPDGDWARDGNAIGGNVHIKGLCFGIDLGNVVARDKFESFCAGLACNKSVEELFIRCNLFGGEIFTMLSPFFEQNSNLCCLVIYGGFHNLPNGVRFLSESLLRFNTLREFLM